MEVLILVGIIAVVVATIGVVRKVDRTRPSGGVGGKPREPSRPAAK